MLMVVRFFAVAVVAVVLAVAVVAAAAAFVVVLETTGPRACVRAGVRPGGNRPGVFAFAIGVRPSGRSG